MNLESLSKSYVERGVGIERVTCKTRAFINERARARDSNFLLYSMAAPPLEALVSSIVPQARRNDQLKQDLTAHCKDILARCDKEQTFICRQPRCLVLGRGIVI